MPRPKAITALTVLYLLLGAMSLLLALPARRLAPGYMIFGSWVSPTTYMYWIILSGVIWLGLAFAFHQGLALGLWIYLGLKASHWGVSLLSGGLGAEAVPALVVDGAILLVVWKNRDWFRN